MNDVFDELESQLRRAVRSRRRSRPAWMRRGHARTSALVILVTLVTAGAALAASGVIRIVAHEHPRPVSTRPRNHPRPVSGASGSVVPRADTPTHLPPAHVPSGIVATVNGTAITTAAYNQALQASAPPEIRPLLADPRAYGACVTVERAAEQRWRFNEEHISPAKERAIKELEATVGRSVRSPAPKRKSDAQLKQQCERQLEDQKLAALRSVIHSAWMEGQAKELGITVSESEVAPEVKARLISQNAVARSSKLAAQFLPRDTEAEVRRSVRDGLLYARIYDTVKLLKRPAVSPAQAKKYYEENTQKYLVPEGRTVLTVMAKSQHAGEEAANHGHSSAGGITALAQTAKITPTPRRIGCGAGLLHAGSLSSAFCSASTGVIMGPVKEGPKYYLFEVKSTTPAAQQSFAQVQKEIKQDLSYETMLHAQHQFLQENAEKWKARTECGAGYVIDACKESPDPAPLGPG